MFSGGLRAVAAAGLLALFAGGVAWTYVGAERFIYFWDYATYQDLAQHAAARVSDDWRSGWRAIHASLGQNYNWLFAVPLLPLALTLDLTRQVFVTALTLLYQVPFALAVGALTRRLFSRPPAFVAWIAALVTLLLPSLWAATLRGYPDVGGAAFLATALWCYLRRPRRGVSVSLLATAVMLAGAMLFRRHYAYGAVAFFLTLGLTTIVHAVTARTAVARWTVLRHDLTEAGVLGFGTLATLLLPGPAFVGLSLRENYLALYQSYMLPPQTELWEFWRLFGGACWVLAGLGWSMAYRLQLLDRSAAGFVLTYGLVALGLWVGVVRQWGWHYGYHGTWLVVPGLVALGASVAAVVHSRAARTLLATAAALALLVNLGLSLGPKGPRLGTWLPSRVPPFVRADVEEVHRLIAYLRAHSRDGDPILVAASSEDLNFDILVHADRVRRDPRRAPLNVLISPQVDSVDGLPVEDLLRARFVVDVSPFQRHLPEAEQDVVKVLHTAFVERWATTADFTTLPERFTLRRGAEVRVHRRIAVTPPAAAVGLVEAMERAANGPFGLPRTWIALGPTAQWTSPSRPEVHLPLAEPQHLLLTTAPSGARWTVQTRVRTQAPAPHRVMFLVLWSDQDRPIDEWPVLASQAVQTSTTPSPLTMSGALPVPTKSSGRLVLAIAAHDGPAGVSATVEAPVASFSGR